MTSIVSYLASAVSRRVACESCTRAVELECEGIAGMAGDETYKAYVCPSCRTLNRVRTPGGVISARPAGVT